MVELHTDRLRLVPLDASHTQAVHEMSTDPEVRRYLWEGKIIPVRQVEEMIGDSQACFSEVGTGFFAIRVELPDDPHDGEFVGFAGHRHFSGGERMELLIGLKSRFWGRGFGREALREVMRHGFHDCGIPAVLAAVDTPNQRSVRVLQRLGMSFLERREWRGLDTMFYEMTADDFNRS